MDLIYIDDERFENLKYQIMPLTKGEYESCLFSGCDFSNSDLSEIRFVETEFIDCEFSNAKIVQTSFQDITFKNCKILGLQFPDSNEFGFNATFKNCQLNYSTFTRMKINKINFENSQLHHTDFTGAQMKSAVLKQCDLFCAIFDQTNLEKADLRSSINYTIDPEKNRLKGARFLLPEVAGLLKKYSIKIDPF
ncbi:MAG: pentapeptide repeat-containing protein [Deltaproteobacteria bacterium]|nr:pentapeptide repeat-containing protein [Deltaproteobacteria bacterium]